MIKYEAMRRLLDELRTARPLLLYGDQWIAEIERVLALPDDDGPDPSAPCGKCNLRPGKRCFICGARAPTL